MAKKGKKNKNAVGADGTQTLATNRRARHDFKILEEFECGIVLLGPEYSMGSWTNHSPKRTRKLLLHRREIDKIMGQVRDGNKTLIPLKVYLRNGYAKLELGLAQGKQDYDKREDIKRRDQDRDITRELGRRIKGINA